MEDNFKWYWVVVGIEIWKLLFGIVDWGECVWVLGGRDGVFDGVWLEGDDCVEGVCEGNGWVGCGDCVEFFEVGGWGGDRFCSV